jgi:hypothetical protein
VIEEERRGRRERVTLREIDFSKLRIIAAASFSASISVENQVFKCVLLFSMSDHLN